MELKMIRFWFGPERISFSFSIKNQIKISQVPQRIGLDWIGRGYAPQNDLPKSWAGLGSLQGLGSLKSKSKLFILNVGLKCLILNSKDTSEK